MPSTICHNLDGCMDNIWHFGRADLDTYMPMIDAHLDPSAQSPADPSPSAGSDRFLHPLFCRLKRHSDGVVSLQEMRSLLCTLPENDVSHACLSALVQAATRTASETFDFAQFAELYESVFNELVAAEKEEDVVEEAFRVYDRNRDGFISASELATVLTELGLMAATSDVAGVDVAAQVEKCQAFIDRVDSDGNGLVDFQEFRAMLMRNQLFPSSSKSIP